MDMKAFDLIALVLPDFEGTSFLEFTNISGLSGAMFRASWQAPPVSVMKFMVSAGQYITADEQVQILLPSTAGLVLPRQGLMGPTAGITIQGITSNGQTSETPLLDVPNVGALDGTPSLDFFPRVAGENVEMTLNLKTCMNLTIGDQIILWLPGFSAPSAMLLGVETLVEDSSTNSLQGSWSGSDETLTLKVYQTIKSFQTIIVRIARNAGIRLPAHGISLIQNKLGISVSSVAGAILRSYLAAPAIGFFSASDISFSPALADSVSEIVLSFVPQMYVQCNETVTIVLPGFYCPLGSHSLGAQNLQAAAIGKASWNQTESAGALTLFAKVEIKPGTLVQVVVGSGAGILTPVQGVLLNDPSLTIESNAADGPVQPTSISDSLAIGALGTSSLSFSPPCSGQITEITFEFFLFMNIAPNAVITLKLPNFNGPAAIYFTIMSTPASAFAYAKWNEDNGGGLLQLARDSENVISRLTNISITISAVAGLSLPNRADLDNQGEITMEVSNNDEFGSLQQTSIGTVQRIFDSTIFYNSSLAFDPTFAMQFSEITIEFRVSQTINPGDQVTLTLPGFIGNQRSFESILTKPASLDLPSSWQNVSNSLVFTFPVATAANALVVVRVPTESGIKLPRQGVAQNQQDLTLRLNTNACSLKASSVELCPLVQCKYARISLTIVSLLMICNCAALLSYSLLDYDPLQVDVSVNIHLSFVPQISLPYGSLITVTLQDFSGQSSDNIMIFSSPEGAITTGTWNATSYKLSVRVNQQISPGKTVSFMVRSMYGISIPSSGLVSNQSSLLLEANVGSIYIPPSIIWKSTAVNSSQVLAKNFQSELFVKQPTITFHGSAGNVTSLMLNITLRSDLNPYDVLIVNMPGFSGSFAGQQVLGQNGKQFTASLNTKCKPATLMLAVNAGAFVEAYTSISILLPSFAGLTLPQDGIMSDGNITLIFKLKSIGCVFNPIGAVNMSSIHFVPGRVSAPVALILTIRPVMRINMFDSVALSLPGFFGGGVGTTFVGSNFIGEWTGDYPDALFVFYITRTDSYMNETLVLNIGSRFGIRLPIEGVRKETRLKLAISAYDGSYSDFVGIVQAVGSLQSLDLTFESASEQPIRAGKQVSVTISFVLHMPLTKGDNATVSLPGFSWCYGMGESPSYQVSYGVVPLWNPDQSFLTLLITGLIAAGNTLTVSIEKICFPTVGIRTNTSLYTLAISATEGSILETPFPNVQVIGSFEDSSLAFENVLYNSPSQILISFIPNMNLEPGENVSIHLPGFYAIEPTSTIKNVNDSRFFAQVIWNSASERLDLIVGNNSLSNGSDVRLQILSTAGLMLPSVGIRINQSTLTIGTTAKSGPVADTPIVNVQPVGSFRCSSLSFTSDIEGSPTDVILIFVAEMNFVVGDQFSLNLPSFASNDAYDLSLNISWSGGGHCDFLGPLANRIACPAQLVSSQLTFEMSSDIPALSTILVNASNLGIIIPELGLQANQSNLTISTSAKNGPVVLSPITNVPQIGSLLMTPSLTYLPVSFNQTTSLILSFQCFMDILVGDQIFLFLPNFAAAGVVRANWTIDSYVPKNVTVAQTIISYKNITREFNTSIINDSASCKIVSNKTTEVQKIETIVNTSEVVIVPHSISVSMQAKSLMLDDNTFVLEMTVSTPIRIWDSEHALQNKDMQPKVIIKIDDVKLPMNGVSSNQANVMLEIKSAAGLERLGKMPIPFVSPAGAFSNISLDFNPRKTEEQVDISINLSPAMDILRGELIIFKLPKFIGQSVFIQDATSLDIDNTVQSIEWNQTLYSLTLVLGRDLIGGFEELAVMIPGSMLKVQLPISGLLPNQPGIAVSCNARAGPVYDLYGVKTPSIGSFLSSEILFAPPVAGAYVGIALNFSARMDLIPGDSVFLALNPSCDQWCCSAPDCSFQSDGPVGLNVSAFVTPASLQNRPVDCGQAARAVMVQWNPATSILQVLFFSAVAEGCQVLVGIPSLVGIKLPRRGLQVDPLSGVVKSLTIASNAIAGHVLSTIISKSWPIGSFLSSTSISFVPPKVKEVVKINISFMPVMNITVGEFVEITLAGFSGPLQYRSLIPSTLRDQFLEVLWVNAVQTLRVTVLNVTLSANTVCGFQVPLAYGIVIPGAGVAGNQSTLTLRTSAKAGPVLDVPIVNTEAVGSFLDSSALTFDQPRANSAPRNIFINFRYSFAFTYGDQLVVSLPGFQSADLNLSVAIDTVPINALSPTVLAFWEAKTTCLTLSWPSVQSSNGQQVWMQITCDSWNDNYGEFFSFCLNLPSVGLVANQTNLMISTNARAGPILPTSFARSQAVGAFFNSSLIFLPPAAGSVAAMNLTFVPQMTLQVGEKVVLTLPGFEGNTFNQLSLNVYCKIGNNESSLSGYAEQICANCSWDGANKSVVLILRQTIQSRKWLELDIPSDLGVRLPTDGIRLLQLDPIRIETNAFAGSVLPTKLSKVTSVGAFKGVSTSIGYHPPKVEENVSLMLNFTAVMDIGAGDTILFDLPGFRVPSSLDLNISNFNVSVEHICDCSVGSSECECSPQYLSCPDACTSSQGSSRLLLTSTIHVPAPSPVFVTIDAALGFQLPREGVSATCCMLISAYSQNGNIYPTRLSQVQAVGSFNDSVDLDFVPPSLGVEVDLIVSFVPMMSIGFGEEIEFQLPSLTVASNIQAAFPSGSIKVLVFNYVSLSNSTNSTITGIWSVNNSRLILRPAMRNNSVSGVQFAIPRFTKCQYRITSSLGPMLVLPSKGLVANFANFTASSNALDGPVLPTSILSSPGIYKWGNFTWSSLTYGAAAVAGQNISISLELICIMTIYPADVISLLLPDFGAMSSRSVGDLGDWGLLPFNFSGGSNLIIRFLAKKKFAALTKFRVEVSELYGISLPRFGVLMNQQNIQIRGDFAAGSVNWTTIISSPGVGSLSAMAVSFPTPRGTLPKAGEVTALSVTFSVYSMLHNGTTIKISLAQFSGSNLSVSAASNEVFGPVVVSVSKFGSTLYVPVVQTVPRNTTFSILFDSAYKIMLPLNGVRENQSSIQISHDDLLGPVAPQSFQYVQPVGALIDTSVLFSPGLAGAANGILISFVPQMPLTAKDIIFLNLPLFHDSNSSGINSTTELQNLLGKECNGVASLGSVSHAIGAMCKVLHSSNYTNSSLLLALTKMCKSKSLEIEMTLEQVYNVLNMFMQSIKNSSSAPGYWASPYVSSPLVDSDRPKNMTTTNSLSGSRTIQSIVSWKGSSTKLKIDAKLAVFSGVNSSNALNPSAGSNQSTLFYGIQIAFSFEGLGLSFIQSGVQVNLSISLSTGVQTPVDGIRKNAQITMSSDAHFGPMPDTLVDYIQPIGVMSAQVSYLSMGLAGMASPISLTFVAAMNMVPGDRIHLFLPGFSSCPASDKECNSFSVFNQSCLGVRPCSENSNLNFSFLWSQPDQSLTVQIRSDIPANRNVEVLLPAAVSCVIYPSDSQSICSLFLPRTGVTASSGLLFSVEAINGPVSSMPLATEFVGAFESTSLNFDDVGLAGGVSPLTLTFKSLVDITACESVFLNLPMFSYLGWGPWIKTMWAVSGRGNWSGSASWNSSVSVLIIDVVESVYANEICTVSIGQSENIQLPVNGIRANQSSIEIGTNAAAGPVSFTALEMVQPVGALSFGPQLQFNPPGLGIAGTVPTALWISFRAVMALDVDDEVGLVFPGCSSTGCADGQFDGPPNQRQVEPQGTEFAASFTAVCLLGQTVGEYAMGSEEVASIRLIVKQVIPPGTLVFLIIPSACGVSLPRNGLYGGEDLEYYVTSVQGSISIYNHVLIADYPYVGAFTNTSLSFALTCTDGGIDSNHSAALQMGRSTSIAFSFTYQTDLQRGEQVVLSLPGFNAPGGFLSNLVTLAIDTSKKLSVSVSSNWASSPAALKLAFNSTLPSRTSVTIYIPAIAGIRLPSGGVSMNQQSIVISTLNAAGPVAPTPLANVQPVGVILFSSITFDTFCPGHNAVLTLLVIPAMGLEVGDTVLLRLPGFGGMQMTSVIYNVQGLQWNLTWSPEMSLFQAVLVQGNTFADVAVLLGPVNVGLILPKNVTAANSSAFLISASSGSWTTCWVPIVNSPAINCTLPQPPAIISESALYFNPPRAAAVSNITLRFHLGLGILQGSNISVQLPGFYIPGAVGNKSRVVRVQANDATNLFNVWWIQSDTNGTLVLKANRSSGPVVVSLVLPSINNITLPPQGIMANQTDFVIQTLVSNCQPLFYDCRQVAGVVFSAPIQLTPAIGVFLLSSLYFSPQIAGQATNVNITFALSAALHLKEHVDLLLPGFGGSNSLGFISAVGAGVLINTTRNAATGIISLTVVQGLLARGSVVTLAIGIGFGVEIPADGIAPEILMMSTNSVDGPVLWTVVQDAPQVYAYRCFSAIASVSGGRFCSGNRSVQVCARTQTDATNYATALAGGVLRNTTISTCQQANSVLCSRLGGNTNSPTPSICCSPYGVEESAGCMVDGDCAGLDSRSQNALEPGRSGGPAAVPIPAEQCCDYCKGSYLYEICSGLSPVNINQACQQLQCSSTTPCFGNALYSIWQVVDPKVGGQVKTALGAGILIPPGVWPVRIIVAASVEASAQPSISKDQVLALLGKETLARRNNALSIAPLQVTAILTLGPSGIVFSYPGVTVEFPADVDLVEFGVSNGLQLASFRRANSSELWVKQPFVPWLNSTARSLLVTTLGFSDYVVFLMPLGSDTHNHLTNVSGLSLPHTTAAPTAQGQIFVSTPVPSPVPPPEAGVSIALIAGVAGGVVSFFLVLTTAVVCLIRRGHSYKYQGLLSADSKPLLASTTIDVPVHKLPSTVSKPGSETREPARPKLVESDSTVKIQSDLIMRDGTSPAWEDTVSEVCCHSYNCHTY